MATIPVRVDPSITPHVVRSGFVIEPGHPLHSTGCPVCDEPLHEQSVSLVFVGREPDDRGWTGAAVAVHDGCTGVRNQSPVGPARWIPGAGWERLRREAPHLIPSEISAEDLQRADEIIAAGDAADLRLDRG